MPNEDGQAGPVSPVAAGLRGVQQADAGQVVRTAQGEGTVAGPHRAATGASHHSVPPPAHPGPTLQASNQIAMQTGTNCKLTQAEVDQAVKLRTHHLCLARGIAVPEDPVDFLNRAQVHWVAGDGAMVTWEH